MKMRTSISRHQSAMTIIEMIVATGVFSVAMAAMIGASIALQTSFSATDDYFTAEGDQLRVMDYFNTDLRRALAVQKDSNTVSYTPPGGAATTYSYAIGDSKATKYFTMVIPNYRDLTDRTLTTSPLTVNMPKVSSDNKVDYGQPIVVCYYLSGSSLYRAEVNPNLPSSDTRNNPRSIADNVSDFNVSDPSFVKNPLTTQTFVQVSATFAPKYSRKGWAAALSSNTDSRVGTTLGSKVQLRNVF